MRQLVLYISIFLFGLSQAQTASFSAKFRSLENGEPILYAKVSTAGGPSKLTNIDGFVVIEHLKGAEIVITHLIYDTLHINTAVWEERDSLVFYLKPRVYNLKEVRFSILGNRSLFDNKFVKNDLGKSDEEKIHERLNIPGMKKELKTLNKLAQDGFVVGSPISFLYNRYSKAGKERAKYAMLVERDRRRKISKKEFDNLTVTTLTNYEDEELQKFKEFCSFHPTYLEAVDALTLYFEILRCRDEYKEKGY